MSKQVNVEVRAEYACGHHPRVITSGKCRPESLHEDMRRMSLRAVTDGMIDFNCHCGHGAAFVEIVLDGKIIDRTPASKFTTMPGARVTMRDQEPGLKPNDLENICDLGLDGNAARLVAQARKRVQSMDKVDGGMGHLPPDMDLRTILAALNCALKTEDWGTAADAYCMLQDLELVVRKIMWS